MNRSLAALMLVALALCGCVLQSRVPIFTDAAGELVLGPRGGQAVLSSWMDGEWVRNNDTAKITIAGQHYEATSDSSVIALTFVRLSADWYVLQAVENNKPAVYMLAEVKDKSAEVHSLPCSDLKKDAGIANWISYEGDDCFIEPGAPASTLFAALLKTPGEPTSRFELLK